MEFGAIIGPSIAGILSLCGIIWLERKAATRKDVQDLHVTFNSKMDRLLEEVIKRATAEGRAAGVEEERLRTEEMRQVVREEKRIATLPEAAPDEIPAPITLRILPKKDE